MSIYDKLVGKNSEKKDFLLETGASMLRTGLLKEAEEVFKKAIKISPQSAEAHLHLGILFEQTGKIKKAEKEYKKTIKLEPENTVAHIQMGSLFFNLNRYGEAEREFRAAITINPNTLEAYTNLGALLLKTGRYDEAEKELRHAIGINPNIGLPHRNLGVVLTKIYRTKEALSEFEIAMKLHQEEGDQEAARNLKPIIEKLKRRVEVFEDIPPVHDAYKETNHDNEERPIKMDDRWARANGVLNQLFEIYIDPKIPPGNKQRLVMDIIEDNRHIIFEDSKFFELLNSEINKTKRHGPPFMALMYLELRWTLTGENKHLKEMEDYSRKVEKLSFEQLIDISL